MTSTNLLRALDVIDRELLAQEADLLADQRARLLAKANPFAHVVAVDECGAPILDPSAPELACENV